MASQKILIVDDSKAIRAQVREMLSKGNFEVAEAADGVEGLDFIRNQHPNLVLLDFFMPRMNGWEVLLRIQSLPDLQMIPIVVMTGRKIEVQEKVPELFKYFEFIEKPFDPRTLINAVRAAMAKAMSRQSVAYALSETGNTASATPDPPVVSQTAPNMRHASPALGGKESSTATIEVAPLLEERVQAGVGTLPPQTKPAPSNLSPDELTRLQTEVELLQEGNAKLQGELDSLKQQMSQLIAFMKQKLG